MYLFHFTEQIITAKLAKQHEMKLSTNSSCLDNTLDWFFVYLFTILRLPNPLGIIYILGLVIVVSYTINFCWAIPVDLKCMV
jgi:hypothetical protein